MSKDKLSVEVHITPTERGEWASVTVNGTVRFLGLGEAAKVRAQEYAQELLSQPEPAGCTGGAGCDCVECRYARSSDFYYDDSGSLSDDYPRLPI